MASTNTAAGAGTQFTFPPRGLVISGNVSMAQYCDAMRDQFHKLATYFDAEAVALSADLRDLMRANGLDGQNTIGPLSFGSSASRVAAKVVKPLRAASSDCENIARGAGLLKRLGDREVWDVLLRVQAERERRERGAGLRLGA